MKYIVYLFIISTISCGVKANDSVQILELDNNEINTIKSGILAEEISISLDSTQMIINIAESKLIDRLLNDSTFKSQDSVYFLSLNISQRFHMILKDNYEYENILMSFKFDDKQKYYFNFCVSNCR